MITSSYTPCLVSTDPTLTPDNLTRVLEIMEDEWWDTFAQYINLPESVVNSRNKIRSQHASDRDRKLALSHVFISAHPTPSWELVAHALYQMGTFNDSYHRALEYLQQHFPTGTVCMYPGGKVREIARDAVFRGNPRNCAITRKIALFRASLSS